MKSSPSSAALRGSASAASAWTAAFALDLRGLGAGAGAAAAASGGAGSAAGASAAGAFLLRCLLGWVAACRGASPAWTASAAASIAGSGITEGRAGSNFTAAAAAAAAGAEAEAEAEASSEAIGSALTLRCLFGLGAA